MELQRIKKFLKEFGSARITEKELREHLSIADYVEYHHTVMELIQNSIIIPVTSSGLNGMTPPLHKRYTIRRSKVNYDEVIPEIRLLHSRLNIEGYLNDPKKYKKHRPWLSYLDSFLKTQTQRLEIALSINERSFQIFKKEKALKDDKELAVILHFNPGIREILNYYYTPEPFFTYVIRPWETEVKGEKLELNILIVENKDTWYTLRSRLSMGHSCIAGTHFDCLIYGEGKKISRKIDSLAEFDKSFFKMAKTYYFYFGDLDYEGVAIVHDLIKVNPTLAIKVMKPLYIAMLKASSHIQLPFTKENQNKKAAEWFLSLFEPEHQKTIRHILECGTYIPQEILNNGEFIEMISESSHEGNINV